MSKKAIFIDRDGTIIKEPADEQIDSLEKLEFVPGAISGLRSLTDRGYELVMVSNQDGLGTASFPEETFWPAHNRMLSTLEGEGVRFDDILIDRSFPEDNAPTRKPHTGMLTAYLGGDYDLGASFVIGDRLTDIELARNLGARGILIAPPATAEKPEGCMLVSESWDEIARHILSADRTASITRNTSETRISLSLDLDGNLPSAIDSGLKFFDHMLWQLPHHAGISLDLRCKGDLEVDEHHSMEDIAIVLGQAIDKALGSKKGIDRYGFVLPMDECRAMVLIDFGGRADFVWDVEFTREYVGDTPTEMYSHFFKSLCSAMRCNLHISARGENNHHLIEGVFKAFARALRMAIRRDVFSYNLPSSKGIL
ncbi:MAG: bifunctional histidinol-phosphatase/imidazoleglycerol-phosphate dehydratase HisB [Duncaniella sp.]|uniref:bifunctional histidinol-phosphatase/imidazoleglycerol-phosphate dehydratase HisB n=1 Tax=Duncaniella sp. TaxID=2518496 RepID=UPI0023CF93DE|nr:bifunctional histidinol-phosphatase/imidazoleglycerol-phosphate dehydratase HisB [Duncaniella sp.]MDE5987998.1 bifunctional histidinol-phosphatase/imidazoleglycerol-phosphate dehydratase HisB [Duncaniella sp.]